MIENEKLDDEGNNNKNIIKQDDKINNEKEEENFIPSSNNLNINENDNVDNKTNTEELNNSFYDENKDIGKSNIIKFTVIIVGDSNVGKTCILKKFMDGVFPEKTQCNINVDFSTKNLKIDKNLYAELKIFDTAGQEKYRSLTRSYYHQAEGIILVFDLTNENSFIKLNKWINDINENTDNVEIILVGNKTDLIDRKISKERAENFAKEKNFKYIETSAKDGTNILLLFEELATGIYKRRKEDNSICDIKSVDTYIFRRTELNKLIKNKKEKKCCQF